MSLCNPRQSGKCHDAVALGTWHTRETENNKDNGIGQRLQFVNHDYRRVPGEYREVIHRLSLCFIGLCGLSQASWIPLAGARRC